MKKFTAILLAVLMLLSLASLAACTESADTNAGTQTDTNTDTNTNTETNTGLTEEDLRASKPNEYIQEKLDAGMTVTVACMAIQEVYFLSQQLFKGIADKIEPYGLTYEYICGDGNPATQLNQIETVITEGRISCIVLQTIDPASMQDSVEAAQEAGITVIIYGIDCDYDTIVSTVDNYSVGVGAVKMAEAWCDQMFPGETGIKTAITGSQAFGPLIEMWNGFHDEVAADGRFDVVFEDNDTSEIEDGYNAAQNALMANPDIHVFITYMMSASLGINNYLEANNFDMSQIGIFTTSVDDTTFDMLAAAGENQAAIRGTVSAGEDVSATTARAVIGALIEGTVKIGDRLYDPLTAITSPDYVCDWSLYT